MLKFVVYVMYIPFHKEMEMERRGGNRAGALLLPV